MDKYKLGLPELLSVVIKNKYLIILVAVAVFAAGMLYHSMHSVTQSNVWIHMETAEQPFYTLRTDEYRSHIAHSLVETNEIIARPRDEAFFFVKDALDSLAVEGLFAARATGYIRISLRTDDYTGHRQTLEQAVETALDALGSFRYEKMERALEDVSSLIDYELGIMYKELEAMRTYLENNETQEITSAAQIHLAEFVLTIARTELAQEELSDFDLDWFLSTYPFEYYLEWDIAEDSSPANLRILILVFAALFIGLMSAIIFQFIKDGLQKLKTSK